MIFQKMISDGVKLVAGDDAGWEYTRFDEFAFEVEAMHLAGLSPIKAFQSATRDAAQSIGMDKIVGTIEEKKQADILIVEGDPLKDLMNLRKVRAVFKAGERFC